MHRISSVEIKTSVATSNLARAPGRTAVDVLNDVKSFGDFVFDVLRDHRIRAGQIVMVSCHRVGGQE